MNKKIWAIKEKILDILAEYINIGSMLIIAIILFISYISYLYLQYPEERISYTCCFFTENKWEGCRPPNYGSDTGHFSIATLPRKEFVKIKGMQVLLDDNNTLFLRICEEVD